MGEYGLLLITWDGKIYFIFFFVSFFFSIFHFLFLYFLNHIECLGGRWVKLTSVLNWGGCEEGMMDGGGLTRNQCDAVLHTVWADCGQRMFVIGYFFFDPNRNMVDVN